MTTHNAEPDQGITGCYATLNEFFSADLSTTEEIFAGVHRGEVAGLVAVTNVGKTTLLLNLCLSLAAGEMCLPLAPYPSRPRRILFVDAESPGSILRDDLKIMQRQIKDAATARENFGLFVDSEIQEESLNMENPKHFRRVAEEALRTKADLIVLDTITECFSLRNENDNSEVIRVAMKPLRKLARMTDAAIVYTHHISTKYNEGQTTDDAHKGRAATAFGDKSRSIFLLQRDAKKGNEYVVLSLGKKKKPGVTDIEPTLLKLNKTTRFFEVCAEQPSAPKTVTAEDIAAFVKSREGSASTGEICKHFADRESPRTIKERIKSAESVRLIKKLARGKYQAVEAEREGSGVG